jgi:hypothetical protein
MCERLLVRSCFLLVVSGSPVVAAPLPERWCPLEMTLALDRPEYLPGEPIIARLTLTNRARETLLVPSTALSAWFECSPADGTYESLRTSSISCGTGRPPLFPLLAGQTLSRRIDVSGRWLVPVRPGRYALRATGDVAFCHKSIEDAVSYPVTSNAVAFEIVAATGAEADAFHLIEQWVMEKVREPAGSSPSERADIAELRAYYWMAWCYEGGPRGRILESTNADRYQAAILAIRYPDYAYFSSALSEDGKVLAALYAMRQSTREAGAAARDATRYWADLLVRDYPDSVEAHEAREFLNDLDRYRRPVIPPVDLAVLSRR